MNNRTFRLTFIVTFYLKLFCASPQQANLEPDLDLYQNLPTHSMLRMLNIDPLEESERWYEKAMQFYSNQNFHEAQIFFYNSIYYNENNYKAHYYYARSLSSILLEEKSKLCGLDLNEIAGHLKKVIELQPTFMDHIANEPDLANFREHFQYLQFSNFKISSKNDIKELLITTPWGTPQYETFNPYIYFYNDGTFILTAFGYLYDFEEKVTIKRKGVYTIENNEVYLTYIENGTERVDLHATLNLNGLHIFNFPWFYNSSEHFTEDACSMDSYIEGMIDKNY